MATHCGQHQGIVVVDVGKIFSPLANEPLRQTQMPTSDHLAQCNGTCVKMSTLPAEPLDHRQVAATCCRVQEVNTPVMVK